MLNTRPSDTRYKQGLFTPKNKDKVIKLNNQQGLFYRSSLEHKLMVYLDNYDSVIKWNTEIIKIPYVKNAWNNETKKMVLSDHIYYPDFYYEMLKSDGTISRIVAEVKPQKSLIAPVLKPNPTAKQLRAFEYSIKEYSKNMDKWKHCIEWCKIKGFEFIIITDDFINKMMKKI